MQQLRDTCTHKVKANSVKQEYEKQDELKRSALRAVSALAQIPKAGEILSFLLNVQYFSMRQHRLKNKSMKCNVFCVVAL